MLKKNEVLEVNWAFSNWLSCLSLGNVCILSLFNILFNLLLSAEIRFGLL